MENVVAFKGTNLKYQVSKSGSILEYLELLDQNFTKGEKSIAFASTLYKNSQEKAIILASDFFNKKYPTLKILIISFDLKVGIFKSFITEEMEKVGCKFKFANNLYFLDWKEILSRKCVPKEVVDDYDLVFWDLPDANFLNSNQDMLIDAFNVMDTMYFISLKSINFNDAEMLRSIQKYYEDHGLDIKLILPWKIEENTRAKNNFSLTKLILSLFRRQ